MKTFTQNFTVWQLMIPAIGALLVNGAVALAEDLQSIGELELSSPASLLDGTEERNLSQDYWRIQIPPGLNLGVGGPLEPFQYEPDLLNELFPPIQANPLPQSFQKKEDEIELQWPLVTW